MRPLSPTVNTVETDGILLRSNAPARAPMRVINAAFDIVRVDLPLDEFRHSRKVWNHVSTERLDPEAALQFSRNGLQLGIADENAWPAIRTILEAADAEVKREMLQPAPGTALALETGAVPEGGESIFVYHRGERLEGKTYEAGAKLLIVDYSYVGPQHGGVELRIGLEIRHDRGEMRWERVGETLRQMPSIDRHQFSELRAGVSLSPGEFLVIGPGELSSNAYLIGARFLADSKDGVRRDTLFFVTPRFQETVVERNRPS